MMTPIGRIHSANFESEHENWLKPVQYTHRDLCSGLSLYGRSVRRKNCLEAERSYCKEIPRATDLSWWLQPIWNHQIGNHGFHRILRFVNKKNSNSNSFRLVGSGRPGSLVGFLVVSIWAVAKIQWMQNGIWISSRRFFQVPFSLQQFRTCLSSVPKSYPKNRNLNYTLCFKNRAQETQIKKHRRKCQLNLVAGFNPFQKY